MAELIQSGLISHKYFTSLLVKHIELELTTEGSFQKAGRSLFIALIVRRILPLALHVGVVAPAVCQIHESHWGGNFEERSCDPSPRVGDSLGEVAWESPLLKGGYTVCDHMPDLGQVSKVEAHVHQRADRTASQQFPDRKSVV